MPKVVDHDARRDEIVQATWRVIRRGGVEHATVRAVAAEAGLSAGSLRHYFPSQSGLVAVAMEHVEARARARIDEIDPTGPVLDRVTKLIEVVLPLDDERRAEMQVWLALCARARYDATLLAQSASAYDGLALLSRSVLGELAQAGLLRDGIDTELEAARLHALIDGLAIHRDLHPERLPIEMCRGVVAEHLASLTHGNDD